MRKKRVLIVEDEALTVLALKHELAELGYEIAGDANTAADALRAAEDNRADLVLMEFNWMAGSVVLQLPLQSVDTSTFQLSF